MGREDVFRADERGQVSPSPLWTFGVVFALVGVFVTAVIFYEGVILPALDLAGAEPYWAGVFVAGLVLSFGLGYRVAADRHDSAE